MGFMFFQAESLAQCVQQVNFNNWDKTGDANGGWLIQNNGTQLYTTQNTVYPTMYVGPDTLINVKITGTFRVEDQADDDFVGFVFGFQETYDHDWANGAGFNMDHEYYLFDWKKNFQTYIGYSALEGFTLNKVDGTFGYAVASVFPGFWQHQNSTTFNVLATQYSTTAGWNPWQTYDFELLYTPTRAVIKIDTDTIFDITGCFEPGLFGFYNYSQRYERYWNFNYELYVDFQMEAQNICLGDTAKFTFIDTGSCGGTNTYTNLDTFYWDLGDGTVTNDTNPQHKYDSLGAYLVHLIATDVNGCVDSSSKTVNVQTSPDAMIAWDPACLGLPMQLADSTNIPFGNAIQWEWDFGDGSNGSVTQHPTHVYTQAGTYTVSLTLGTNGGCQADTTTEVEVFPIPTPDFTLSNECKGDTVYFVDQSTQALGPIVSYEWDIEDDGFFDYFGTTANHGYNIHGDYDVKLRVVDSIGCLDSITKTVTIHPIPTADFEAPGVCHHEPTAFIDSSSVVLGNVFYWDWDFGDGTNGSGMAPSHIYEDAGVKTVTLTVTTDSGCVDALTRQLIVYHLPEADFVAAQQCENLPAVFLDSSEAQSGYVVAWNWTFGDGGTANISGPSHEFGQPGLYDIGLEVTTNYGCKDTVEHSHRIYPAPQANFGWPTTVCEGEDLPLYDQSSIDQVTPGGDAVVAWNWTIEGTTTSIQNPVYTTDKFKYIEVDLTVESNYGCIDSVTNRPYIYDIPKVDFSFVEACQEYETKFTDISNSESGVVNKWFWDFGDGGTSTAEHPAYEYALPGNYEVMLIATTNKGCEDTSYRQVYIPETPAVNFKVIPTAGCAPHNTRMVNLSNISKGDLSYQWYVNGTLFSKDDQPVFTLWNDSITSKNYDIQLVVTSDAGCRNALLQESVVTVYPKPRASFAMEPKELDMFEPEVDFDNTSTQSNRWHWSFGDGETSAKFKPDYTYEASGEYEVRLIAWNQYSCSDTVYREMVVKPITSMYIPNAFTPNNDGVNDKWSVGGFNEGEVFRVRIWNRWGELMYESYDLNFEWEGTMPNSTERAPVGTYVYDIQYNTSEGDPRELHGEFNLIR